jgi:cell division transport system ATP-binding protein
MVRVDKADLELLDRGVLLRLTDVDAGYDGEPVLRGVDFEARAGEAAVVSGPTSAGKTTFMHMLRLALPPRAGRALILDADATRLTRTQRALLKRRIGYVAENPTFIEQWTTFDNIALPLRMAGKRLIEYADDVRELVNYVGLAAHMDEPAGRLSAAARRQAAIARALAIKPDIVLADDPTSGMAPDVGRRIVRLLMEIRRVGPGVVITTQDRSLADIAPARRWRLEHGRVAPDDVPEPMDARV